MPRRPTTVAEGVPLFIVPNVIRQSINLHGEEVEWVNVKRGSHYFYTVRVRIRPVHRSSGGSGFSRNGRLGWGDGYDPGAVAEESDRTGI